MKRRWIAVLLVFAMVLSFGMIVFAEEPADDSFEAAPVALEPVEEPANDFHYVALGDSCGAGVGLPAYMERVQETGQKWIAAEVIEGSYPALVAETLDAGTFDQYHFPGARTADIRYLLDANFRADWVLTGQSAYLSEGVVSKENLDAYRDEVLAAIQDADLITLDVGINDCWLPVIAAIYDISGESRANGDELTVPELVQKYGSLGAVIKNAESYVGSWVKNPFRWPAYTLKLSSALLKWVVDYQVNISAIMNRIYQLNPDAQVLVCGMYNPVQNWSVIPLGNDKLIQKVLQPYYNLLNLRKQAVVRSYRGDASYVDMTGIELISDRFTIPLFEFTGIEQRQYNPHPTEAGAQDQASRILRTLGVE